MADLNIITECTRCSRIEKNDGTEILRIGFACTEDFVVNETVYKQMCDFNRLKTKLIVVFHNHKIQSFHEIKA